MGDVDVFIDGARFDLVGAEEDVAEVHLLVGRDGFSLFFFLDEGLAAGEVLEVSVVYFGELGGVVFFEEFFADVVDDVVFLSGGELGHGHHGAVAFGEGLEEAVGVGAVLEGAAVEFEGEGDGAFFCFVAVAGDAELLVDFFAALEGVGVPGGDDGLVV